MSVNRNFATFLVVSLMCCEKIWCFDSLLDNDLYSISWKGPANLPDDDDPKVDQFFWFLFGF